MHTKHAQRTGKNFRKNRSSRKISQLASNKKRNLIQITKLKISKFLPANFFQKIHRKIMITNISSIIQQAPVLVYFLSCFARNFTVFNHLGEEKGFTIVTSVSNYHLLMARVLHLAVDVTNFNPEF